MATGSRAPACDLERALEYLMADKPSGVRPDAATLAGVRAACASYMSPSARVLFDACLLGRATATELHDTFGVSAAEICAYEHLFFDRTVFTNDFHIVAYIAGEADPGHRAMLKEGFTKGFPALRIKYGSAATPVPANEVLEQIFSADSQRYLQLRDTPMASKAVKDVRALGKHVLATASVLGRVTPPKAERRDDDVDFVIENGPGNPTIDELLARGAQIAH